VRKGIAVAVGLLMGVGFAVAHADDTQPYEEYSQHLRTAQNVAALGDNAFGDQINLYNGATEFDVTDVSIPGNNALPVAVGRRFRIDQRRIDPGYLGGFGEWDLDIPYIEAVVTTEKGWILNGSTPYARCSDNTDVPNTYVSYYNSGLTPVELDLVYDGTKLHVPGEGEQELLANNQSKSPAYSGTNGPYKWVTTSNWKFSCLGSTANGYPGEAFVAVSPSGVTYTFNWAVTRVAPSINVAINLTNQASGDAGIYRTRVFLLVTQIKDRFGNTVTYNYNGDELTSIASSDGRSISIGWNNGTIQSVTSEPNDSDPTVIQTWQYDYGTDANGKPTLASVLRPDGSQWSYTAVAGSLAPQNSGDCGPFCRGDGQSPPIRHCQSDQGFTPYAKIGTFTYQITAPSGAVAIYQFRFDRHYRGGVPRSCNDGTTNHDYPYDYSFFDGYSIQSKQIAGPGLPTDGHGNTLLTWSYQTGGVPGDTSGVSGGYYDATGPYDYQTNVYIPPGNGGCPTSSSAYTTTVTGPTSVTLYAFGHTYACDEGRLYGTEVAVRNADGSVGPILKTTSTTFLSEQDANNLPYPVIAGTTLLPNNVHPDSNRIRPVAETVITQDQANFTSAVNTNCSGGYCFDAFARATSETETGSASRTTTTAYYDDLTKWVLGQIWSTSTLGTAVPCTNATVAAQTNLTSCTIYDTSTDLPLQSYAFGKRVSTKTWNSDGTL